jgi:hypothetical protein
LTSCVTDAEFAAPSYSIANSATQPPTLAGAKLSTLVR